MKLSNMDLFCWKKATSTSAAYTNVLDFGTDGNSPFEPSTGNAAVDKTVGTHGDDVLHKLFWSLWVSVAAADTSLTVVWETSDNEPPANAANSTTVGEVTTNHFDEVFTKTITASNLVKGAYPIANEVLPKGLKRYNRLRLTATEGSNNSVATKVCPTVSAFIVDGRDEPLV